MKLLSALKLRNLNAAVGITTLDYRFNYCSPHIQKKCCLPCSFDRLNRSLHVVVSVRLC